MRQYTARVNAGEYLHGKLRVGSASPQFLVSESSARRQAKVSDVMIKRVYSCLLLCIALTGCNGGTSVSQDPPTDTEQTNQVRETLGIRPIKKTWLFCYRQFSEETWKDGEFLCKKVARSGVGTAILWEEDYYYSGSTYIDINGGKNWESLTVGYNYGSRQFYLGYVGVSPTLNSLVETLPRSTSVGMMGETNGQTILTADKILTGWNRVRTD